MGRRISFEISDKDWLESVWPECAGMFKDGFRCTDTLDDDGRGCRYELLTADGRTNYNDLNGYEKACLFACQDYFDNRLQIVGLPDYCIAMTVSD